MTQVPSSADVYAVKLSKLVVDTTGPSGAPGDILVVKCDIEGAEYVVLPELRDSNILCDKARAGADVHLLIEMHPFMREWFAPEAPEDTALTILNHLEACGVHVYHDLSRGEQHVSITD